MWFIQNIQNGGGGGGRRDISVMRRDNGSVGQVPSSHTDLGKLEGSHTIREDVGAQLEIYIRANTTVASEDI